MKQLFLDIKAKLLSIPKGPFTPVAKFTGSGLNDISFSNTYKQNQLSYSITVEVIATDAGGDTVRVSDSQTHVDIVLNGGSQPFKYNVFFKADAKTGHTIGDKWTYTITSEPLIQFVQVWNNQIIDEENGNLYNYPKPAVFIEFEAPNILQQGGNGVQIYDDLSVVLHIIDEFYNNTDSTGFAEQNLEVLELKQKVYSGINKFEPTGAVAMVRTSETQDYDHTQIYHFKQGYKTNLVDFSLDEPVNGIERQPPTGADITLIYTKAI